MVEKSSSCAGRYSDSSGEILFALGVFSMNMEVSRPASPERLQRGNLLNYMEVLRARVERMAPRPVFSQHVEIFQDEIGSSAGNGRLLRTRR